MKIARLILFLSATVALVALAAACRNHDHQPAGHGHTHDGHAHGDDESGRPVVSVTRWSGRTELFMEYPVLVGGESSRAAIHVTDLSDFSPVAAGEVIVGLRGADGRSYEFRGEPSQPGIFGADIRMDRPGTYDMTLRVEAPGLGDTHELGPVTVYPFTPEVPHAGEKAGEIAFLKEQQWTLEFGTVAAELRSLRSSFTVPAVIRSRTGGEVTLTAPVPGRTDPAAEVPVPGTRVQAGSVLVRIVPRTEDLRDAAALRAALVEAEQDHGLAASERDRVGRLVDARALPARRLAEAEAALEASTARLAAARERWNRFESLSQAGEALAAGGAFAVRAPFEGIVAEVGFSAGTSVDENQALVRLVDGDRAHVVGAIPESREVDLQSIESGELTFDHRPPIALGRPLAIGRVIDPVSRTSDIRFALDARSAGLSIGQSVRLRLFVGSETQGPAVPESALVDDAGRPVAFVQTGGESFERRPVKLGSRAGGWVHVLEGIEPGERVVHRGAYLVRLATMSTQVPAHGHTH